MESLGRILKVPRGGLSIFSQETPWVLEGLPEGLNSPRYTQGFITDFHYYVCPGPVLVLATGACAAAATAHYSVPESTTCDVKTSTKYFPSPFGLFFQIFWFEILFLKIFPTPGNFRPPQNHNGPPLGWKIGKLVRMLISIAQKKGFDALNTTQKTPDLCKVPFLKKSRKIGSKW